MHELFGKIVISTVGTIRPHLMHGRVKKDDLVTQADVCSSESFILNGQLGQSRTSVRDRDSNKLTSPVNSQGGVHKVLLLAYKNSNTTTDMIF